MADAMPREYLACSRADFSRDTQQNQFCPSPQESNFFTDQDNGHKDTKEQMTINSIRKASLEIPFVSPAVILFGQQWSLGLFRPLVSCLNDS